MRSVPATHCCIHWYLALSLAALVITRVSRGDEPAPTSRPSGTREMLDLFGVDEAARSQWADGKPFAEDDPAALLSVLYSVRRFETGDLERWTHRDVTWQQLFAEPDRYRGEFISLSGTLRSVETIAPPPALAARFELRTYYRSTVAIGEPPAMAAVITLEVPRAWLDGNAEEFFGQPVRFHGLFLVNSGTEPAAPFPVLVAPRIGWQSDSMLGRLGMDVGLFDTIENRQPLTRREREVFYQLLAACGRAEERELSAATEGPVASVVPLFNKPEEQHGRLVAIEGTARRAVPIRIEEADLRERFGLDQYYELEVFSDDSQGNPLVFCVLELPEGFPQGDRLAERVRVPAFFFKSWAYPAAGAGEGRVQLAPLLVGRSARWLPSPNMARSTWVGLILGGLFVAGLAGVGLALWWTARADRRIVEARRASHMAVVTPHEFERLALEGESKTHRPPGAG